MSDKHNLTLALDADLLERARVVAVRRRTTVTRMVRDYLRTVVDGDEAWRGAAERLRQKMEEAPLSVGGRRWTRDELHER